MSYGSFRYTYRELYVYNKSKEDVIRAAKIRMEGKPICIDVLAPYPDYVRFTMCELNNLVECIVFDSRV